MRCDAIRSIESIIHSTKFFDPLWSTMNLTELTRSEEKDRTDVGIAIIVVGTHPVFGLASVFVGCCCYHTCIMPAGSESTNLLYRTIPHHLRQGCRAQLPSMITCTQCCIKYAYPCSNTILSTYTCMCTGAHALRFVLRFVMKCRHGQVNHLMIVSNFKVENSISL